MADHGGAHDARLRAAVGLRGAWSGDRLLPALLALAVWVIFLNGGTLAINSVFDKDEGDIGYLMRRPRRRPPARVQRGAAHRRSTDRLRASAPVPSRVRYLFRAVDALLGAAVPLQGRGGSRLGDQHVGLRDAHAVCRVGRHGPSLDAGHASSCLPSAHCSRGSIRSLSCIKWRKIAPGDRTLALLLGLRASLGVAIASTALAFALLGWAAAVLGVRAWLLVVPLIAWLAVLLPWYRCREALPGPVTSAGCTRRSPRGMTDLVVLLVFAR